MIRRAGGTVALARTSENAPHPPCSDIGGEAVRQTVVVASIVLIGTPEWHDLLHPTLTCVERPEAEKGRQAALLLLHKVEAPEYRQPKIMLPTQLLRGASVLGIPK